MGAVQVHPPDPRGDVAEGILTTTDFVDCYKTHYRRLIRALRLSGADLPQAEDVAQESFARALARWRRVSKGPNPAGYVYTTAFRLLQRGRRRPVEMPRGEPHPAAEGAAIAAVSVEVALRAMPPKRRACAVMCLLVGLPVHDAGAALGIADGTVRKHLDEARRDLRDSWGEIGGSAAN